MASSPQNIKALFEPANKAHAIIEAVFFCEFHQPFERSVIDRLLTLEHDETVKADLPGFKRVEGGGIAFSAKDSAFAIQRTVDMEPVGVLLEHFQPNGTADWVVRVMPKVVSIHCLDYTTWSDVWERVQKYFNVVFQKITPSQTKVVGLGLKYIDHFKFNGQPEEYDPKLLFSPSSEFLHGKALTSSGYRWHCHSGWFETIDNAEPDRECLNQVNIDATGTSGGHLTKIEHSMVIQGFEADTEYLMVQSEVSDTALAKAMNYLHDSNKNVLRNLLTPEMIKRINL
ncbi:TIGR04255 family protein [Vampirovibrio sp.]|uniref:TIGR04255 family protein n=1 Tax=Vampirovibrio sp. TaxID=2717857 RepID=UPI00359325C5